MFPPTTTGRPKKRSFRELVREAVQTAAEFAPRGVPHRPHARAPAPPATRSSPPQTPTRTGRVSDPGLHHAGTPSPGAAGLTPARRRPVWEDGRAGRAGATAPQ